MKSEIVTKLGDQIIGRRSIKPKSNGRPQQAETVSETNLLGDPKQAGQIRDDNGLKMKLVWCPPGKFRMGSPANEQFHEASERQVDVELARGFWLGQFEVTQADWQTVMETGPSRFKGDFHPVEQVSWNDAIEFCRRLTQTERDAKRLPSTYEYRLPTEAEWEYAARAGTTTAYYWGADEGRWNEYAWFDGNSNGTSHSVGQKNPNAWGFYDLSGNVWEWCSDWLSGELTGGEDPRGASTGEWRMYRGGSWLRMSRDCSSAVRRGGPPNLRGTDIGFRVAAARVLEPTEQKRPGSQAKLPEFEVLIQNGVVADGRFDDYSDYPPAWKTENGELRCIVRGDKMLSFGSKAYRDFQFEAEYKVTGPRGAVFVAHSEFRGDRPKGYSVGMGGGDSGLTVAGAIYHYAYKSGNIRSLFGGEVARNPKPDEWASIEVTMKGNEITAKINGVVVGKAAEANLDFPSGRVAFAVMPDSLLTLRNVRVRELTGVVTKFTAGKAAGERAVVRLDGVDYPFRWCPAGAFKMGSTTDDAGHINDEGAVNVTLTKGFWTLETEITQAMWTKIMETEPWKGQETAKPGDNYPATFVNFADSTEFCVKLTESARRAGILSAEEKLRLPTEAEWEYACRAGTTTAYSFGNDANQLGDYAWWDGNTQTERYAHLVGTKRPNPWGSTTCMAMFGNGVRTGPRTNLVEVSIRLAQRAAHP